MNTRYALLCWLCVTAPGCGSTDDTSGPPPTSMLPPDSSGGPMTPLPTSTVPEGMQLPPMPGESPGSTPSTEEPPGNDLPGNEPPGNEPPGNEPPGNEPPGHEPPLALDECGLDTGFPGDEFCILPPPPEQGFQVHIGPDDYDDPDSQYVLAAGSGDTTTTFSTISGNTEDVYFFYRQYRMRPSAHHVILTTPGGSFGVGRRIGTANVSQDFPAGGVIAPENEGVGSPLAARSTINVNLHAINVLLDEPTLREVWVNFWYRDPDVVTQPANPIFEVGDVTFRIQPREEVVLGPYTCDIASEGHMLWIYGHRHANNQRFSAWRVRGAQRDLVYEGYDWEEPLLLEYNSLVQNPVADRETQTEGGWSGVLELLPGDQIQWECHVFNRNDSVLRFTNETYLGEMCILDAEMVGTRCGL